MNNEKYLAKLIESIGVSGYENEISDIICNFLNVGSTEKLYTDSIGNVILYSQGLNPKMKIMLVSHMDEVGFQVMNVNANNGIKIKTLGNIKTWNVINQILISQDGKKKGTVYCENPLHIEPYEFEKLEVIPITGTFEIGDVLGYESHLFRTSDWYVGKAIDNRISCFVSSLLANEHHQYMDDVYYVYSTQEEIGMRGVRVAITEIKPDIIIDIDVSPVGINNSLKLGNGVGIKLSDSIGVSNIDLVKLSIQTSIANNIHFQKEVSDCGTSELIITNERDMGAKRLGISIPCKNMHAPLTITNVHDVEACYQLLKRLIPEISKNII